MTVPTGTADGSVGLEASQGQAVNGRPRVASERVPDAASLFVSPGADRLREIISSIERVGRAGGGGACGFLDPRFPKAYESSHRHKLSPFCQRVRWSLGLKKRCYLCDLAGSVSSMSNQCVSLYTCHAGLIDYQIPLYRGDEFAGTFIGGQLVSPHPDYLHIYRICKDRSHWLQLFGDNPILSPERARMICEVLRKHLSRIEGINISKLEEQLELLGGLLKKHADPDYALYDLTIREWLAWQQKVLRRREPAVVPVNISRLVIRGGNGNGNGKSGGNGNGKRPAPVQWYTKGFDITQLGLMAIALYGATWDNDVWSMVEDSGESIQGLRAMPVADEYLDLLDNTEFECQDDWCPGVRDGRIDVLLGSDSAKPVGKYSVLHYPDDSERGNATQRVDALRAFIDCAVKRLEDSVDVSRKSVKCNTIPISGKDARDTVLAACQMIESSRNPSVRLEHLKSITMRMAQFVDRLDTKDEMAGKTAQVLGACGLLASCVTTIVSDPKVTPGEVRQTARALAESMKVFENWPQIESPQALREAIQAFYAHMPLPQMCVDEQGQINTSA